MEREAERMRKLNEEKIALSRDREQKIMRLQREKQQVSNEMVQFAVRNRVDLRTIDRLATQYGIDVKEMKAKYERSTLPPLVQTH
jgi:hypothetical protein